MPHPFFDADNYPWHLPEARAAHASLYSAISEPKKINLIYRQSASNLSPLALNEPPDQIWVDALQVLTVARALKKLCELVLARDDLAAAHGSLRAIVEAQSAAPTVVSAGKSERDDAGTPAAAPAAPAVASGGTPAAAPAAAPAVASGVAPSIRSSAYSGARTATLGTLARRAFRWLFKPFTEAPSLESFADRGYYYFGALFLAPILGLIYWLGYLARAVDSLPLADALHAFLDKHPPFDAIPLKLPIVAFIALCYVAAAFNPKSRQWLGRRAARAFFGTSRDPPGLGRMVHSEPGLLGRPGPHSRGSNGQRAHQVDEQSAPLGVPSTAD